MIFNIYLTNYSTTAMRRPKLAALVLLFNRSMKFNLISVIFNEAK